MPLRSLARLFSHTAPSRPLPDPSDHAEARSGSDADDLRRARRHDYYWHNAQKKLDLRRLDGFGALADRTSSRAA